MENARTKKEPKQSIPTFVETVELLMKVLDFGHCIQPELILNIHSGGKPTCSFQRRREGVQ